MVSESPPLPSSNHPTTTSTTTTENDFISIPPLDLDQQNNVNFVDSGSFQNDFMLEDIDFDLSFDFPDDSAVLNPNFLADNYIGSPGPGLEGIQTDPNGFGIGGFKDSCRIFKSSSPESRHFPGDEACRSSSESRVLNELLPEMHQFSGDGLADVSAYLNVPSPESNGSNHEGFQQSGNGKLGLNCPSPESQGSDNCGSNISEASDRNISVTSSPNISCNSIKCGVVDQKIKLEDMNSNKSSKCSSMLKRKNGSEDSSNNAIKYQKSNNVIVESSNVENASGDEDGKRKARLMRNRESAQLSRQRKKHYVEELEDKVRAMHSTIQDLNAKMSYVMAENANLRSCIGGNVAPPQVPQPPGMYQHPPMMYPWMPCAPPYMVKPQGSQVPLVPIPRLKPQAAAPAPKSCKKAGSKKSETKTKKVASVSFIGLLFFMLLFGGLVPMVNMRYGRVKEPFTSGVFSGSGYYDTHHGRVLTADGQVNGSGYSKTHSAKDYGSQCGGRGQGGGDKPNIDLQNGSEPLMASLYVPRNDKLVKIDGNLIIHSVLASEKAMAPHGSADKKSSVETGLAVPGDLAPAIPGRHPQHYPGLADGQRAIGSGDEGTAKSTVQQWFLEGVAGPMLSSGMCTEVFQFDVSSAIVPATAARNVSMEQRQNATRTNRGTNRRILKGVSIPLSGPSHNISEEHAGGRTGKKENFTGNNSLSSMVVSVLVDPREAGDSDGDGMIGPKSLSRIFVVVLIDSVKYVTYSCMLPFKGSVPLVTT